MKMNNQHRNDRALASGGNSGYESNQNRIIRGEIAPIGRYSPIFIMGRWRNW